MRTRMRHAWLAGVGPGPGGPARHSALEHLRRALHERAEEIGASVMERLASHPIRTRLALEAQRPVDCPECGARIGHNCLALCVAGDEHLEEVS